MNSSVALWLLLLGSGLVGMLLAGLIAWWIQ
jgi:hypothetical protein